jgi:lipopolysaccharide transport system permease protein
MAVEAPARPALPLAGRAVPRPPRELVDLVAHLAHRELRSAHRLTALGWLWPLVRQLGQLAVLVVVFDSVLSLGIEDYPAFVFCGLVVWTWFAAGLSAGTAAPITYRHLVHSPRFPVLALPLVAVAVPLLDALVALPVLGAMLAVDGRLAPAALLVPVLLALLFGFTAGLALLTSALNVLVRDVANAVGLGLLMLFYVTPVFYGVRTVPERFQDLLALNPMTHFVSAMRSLLMDGAIPAAGDLAAIAAATAVSLAAGAIAYVRLSPRFVDEL